MVEEITYTCVFYQFPLPEAILPILTSQGILESQEYAQSRVEGIFGYHNELRNYNTNAGVQYFKDAGNLNLKSLY